MTRPANQVPLYDILTDATGTVTPTLRVSAGGAANGQTLKTYVGTISIAAGANVTLETVATGKTFYITDLYVGANTGTQFSVVINSAGSAIFTGYCKGDTGPIQLAGMETQPSAASGSLVNLVLGTAASTTVAYMINGYEQ